ncbi:MAG: NAD-dependent epimerase/dehydratase family protein, partial [Pseudomonadales bacterium]
MNSDFLSDLPGPIAITGATGFIGRALCQRLEPSRQVIRALSRQADSRLPDTVTVVRGDLSSNVALRTLVRDAAWVVHCAGAVRGASRRAFDAVNVDGTAALLDAMAAAAPKARLIHVSTLAAAQPQLSDYAASKRSAELLVTTRGRDGDLILRPTAVYGPGDRELKPLLDQAMKGMLPRPVGNRRVSLLHIDDLVDALLFAMRTTPGEAGPYPLADARAQGYRWREIAAAAALSPFHFQRLFTRWAGVSPKQFLGYLTLEHAKKSLGRAESVLDAAYDAGLSGPSRLHDLFVGYEGVTPGEYKAMGDGLEIVWGR